MTCAQSTILGAVVLSSSFLLAVACSSKKDESLPDVPAPEAGLTYHADIAPIVAARCGNCHREGGIAPFSLLTYQDLVKVAGIAQIQVNERNMPPWGAYDTDTCKVQRSFQDDLRLSEEEIKK